MSQFIEEKNKNGFSVKFNTQNELFHQKSKFQDVQIVETTHHGKMLINDGFIMLSERDEKIYHEMISHVPLFSHPHPKKILVIGGGDGGTVREICRHPSVEKCILVEIDSAVVEGCQMHIPSTASVLKNDKRVEVLIEDGVQFVTNTNECFDVIIIDSTDPVGPAQPLFGREFYFNISKILNSNGIVVAQGESPFYESEMQNKLYSIWKEFFPLLGFYNFSNMTYPGGLWSFLYGSRTQHPIQNFNLDQYTKLNLDYFYYNNRIHASCFNLPEFQKELQLKF